jgi:hypothetical protein
MKLLFDDYYYQEVDQESYLTFYNENEKLVFPSRADREMFRIYKHLTQETLVKVKEVHAKFVNQTYYFLIYHHQEPIGWNISNQSYLDLLYMRNTGILPVYQNNGIYTAFLKMFLEEMTQKGFTKIKSNHLINNNQVIVPKLKAGFVINGMEVSEVFGTMVNLIYYPYPQQQEAFDKYVS